MSAQSVSAGIFTTAELDELSQGLDRSWVMEIAIAEYLQTFLGPDRADILGTHRILTGRRDRDKYEPAEDGVPPIEDHILVVASGARRPVHGSTMEEMTLTVRIETSTHDSDCAAADHANLAQSVERLLTEHHDRLVKFLDARKLEDPESAFGGNEFNRGEEVGQLLFNGLAPSDTPDEDGQAIGSNNHVKVMTFVAHAG